VRDITQAGLYPANCRLLEAREALPGIPWSNEEAVLVLAFESPDHPLDAWMKRALEICAAHGGVADQSDDDENAHRSGAAGAWRNKFIRAPHYGEHAVARGILSSTFETSMTWERTRDFHTKITKIARDTIKAVTGRDGTVTCRFTHVYPDGPCLYFTFGGLFDPKKDALAQFMEVLSTCTAATVEHGGTTTHHHAVGRFHRPFYDKQRPELFARALRGAKRELDPKGMMNPGVLIDP
jgi:alkyldihydroxyacetonephosphate synthase